MGRGKSPAAIDDLKNNMKLFSSGCSVYPALFKHNPSRGYLVIPSDGIVCAAS